MKKEDFYTASSDKRHKLHGILWQPDKKPAAVLQIVHGMVEFIDVYDEFASYLTENNIAVIGHDHLGHGQSADNDDELGYFHENDGRKLLIQDMYIITKKMKRLYPDIPHFILGHSMGSFCLRKYLTFYGDKIDGALILGSGEVSVPLATFGKALAYLLEKKYGAFHRSKLLTDIAFGNYLRHIKNPETSKDWLSRDKEKVNKFIGCKYSSFTFTLSGYRDMFSIVAYNAKKLGIERIPKELPILIASGDMDPVGDWGKGPKKIYQGYKEAGFKDVELFLYEGARHEILNEINRREVFEDIKNWMMEKIYKKT